MKIDTNTQPNFWENETCEYCGGRIVEKQVTIHRKRKGGGHILIEHVPAGVCLECGRRFYAANVLKLIEERIRQPQGPEREILVPVFSV
jgi:YgiT-type zinc finger domain-containing protein